MAYLKWDITGRAKSVQATLMGPMGCFLNMFTIYFWPPLPPALHLNNGVMDMQMTIVQLLRRAEGECVILISNGPFYSVMKMQIAPSCRAEMEPGDGVAPAAARSKILKSAGEEGPPPPHCQQMS